MTHDVLFSVLGHTGVITLNRPKAYHALTHPMISAIQKNLKLWATLPHIHSVLIEASPCQAFCAGGDIRAIYATGQAHPTASIHFFNDEYQLNHDIYHYPKPYIVLSDGLTFGGGVGISLHSPYSIVSDRFLFSMPETSIGFFPDVGVSHLLAQHPIYGRYLGLTGARLSGAEAKTLGWVHTVVPSDHLNTLKQTLINLDLSIHAFERLHDFLKSYTTPDVAIPYEHEVHTYFQHDSLETILQHLKQASSSDPFAQATYHQLMQKSPLSLALTFRQIQQAQHQSLETCLKTDFRLTTHLMHGADIYEGVRALLIDKDRMPQWSYPNLDCIPKAIIDTYFNAPHEPFHDLILTPS